MNDWLSYSLLAAIQGWCPWCGDHMAWGGGWGMMFVWLLILVLAIVAVVWAVGRARATGDHPERPVEGRGPDRAEAMVREQYARGEIDEETYRQRLNELRRD